MFFARRGKVSEGLAVEMHPLEERAGVRSRAMQASNELLGRRQVPPCSMHRFRLRGRDTMPSDSYFRVAGGCDFRNI